MREYVGAAFNHMIVIDPSDGSFKTQIEFVVIGSSPKWEWEAGSIAPRRTVDEYRLAIGSKELRRLAETLTKQADILDGISTDDPKFRFGVFAKDASCST